MSAEQINRRPSDEREELRPDPAFRLAPGTGGPERPTGVFGRLGAGGTTGGLVVKLVLLALVNGFALFALPRMIEQRAWFFLTTMALATIAIDIVYLRRDLLPLKYLVPGTVLLLLFQLYPVVMTAYLAFTNYGTGNLLAKDQAIEQIEVQSLVTPPDAVRYDAAPLADDAGEVALLLTDPQGETFLGTADDLRPVAAGDLGDFRELSVSESLGFAEQLRELRVPLDGGAIQLTTLRTATTRVPLFRYDPATDTVVDQQEGTVYRPVEGTFTSEDGATITPGWRETIGPENFTRAFTSQAIRGPFLRVFLWTYAFALLSVLTTFALGLALAVAFNDSRMRSRRFYRVLFVIPYALPSFLTALIWGGLLNQEFGAINQLFNTDAAWLTDPWLVKFSILLVNLWLGFPYMFLITTGALQGIPGETLEAARVDGATGTAAFRRVTFPLLLVSVAPLLIGSFAFNFNNFNIIYLLTRGNPPIEGAQTPAGHSDILISYTYRLAFEGTGGADFGFAAAISVLIFVMVAAISAYSFRYTRALEEVNLMATVAPAPAATPPDARDPAAGDRRPVRRDRMKPKRWLREMGWRHLLGVVVGVFALYPVVWVLSAAVNPEASISSNQGLIPANPTLANFTQLLSGQLEDGTSVPFLRWLWNTLMISGAAALGTVFLCALAAYPFSRMRFKGRRTGLLTLLLVQMFPQLLAMIALFLLMVNLSSLFPAVGFGTKTGLLLVYLGGALGLNTWLMKGFFDTLPKDLDESARVDGATHAQIFFRIILPLAAPVLAVIGLLAFIATVNDFLIASILLRNEQDFTLAVGLSRFIQEQYGQRWGPFAAGALMGGLPIVALFMYLQRYLVSGLTAGAVKG